jgi:hypothetical protein
MLISSLRKSNLKKILLFGNDDCILRMLCTRLSNAQIDYSRIEEFNDIINEDMKNRDSVIILVWHPGCIEQLKEAGLEHNNILSKIS